MVDVSVIDGFRGSICRGRLSATYSPPRLVSDEMTVICWAPEWLICCRMLESWAAPFTFRGE